ncbi:MAG: type I methionyl aminopeptidase [Saprospiraceae bacterium]
MVYYKTAAEIELIRTSCLVVSKVLGLVGSLIKPGVTGKELDKKAEELIRDYNGIPGFKGYNDFPSTLCISPNAEVVHGIPNDKEFKDGDIVSVDCGCLLNGFYGDAAYTFAIGDVSNEVMNLLSTTNESLYKGIEKAVVGNRLTNISFAIQNYVERENSYYVVRELVGHGIGRNLHEKPEVPNFGKRGKGLKMKDGLVIAIEPMVNLGTRNIENDSDGWTIYSKDRSPSAHYEHTVVVRKDNADILSTHEYVEVAIKNNPNIREISRKKAIFAD